MAKNQIIKNVGYNGAVQISGILLNLILLPYIARVLGKGALGVNSFGQAVAGYFVLIGNLGITIYGAKTIAERRDDPIEKQQKFAECITYQFFFNLFAILLYNGWVLLQGDNIYFLFNLVILTSMTDLSWAYTGMERFDLIAVRNLLIKIVGTFSVFLFVRAESDLIIFILIQQGVLLISNVVFWFELEKIELLPRFAPVTQSLRNVIKPAVLLFIPSIFTSLYLSLNKVMLGYLSSIGEVAIYDYPNRLVRIAITFIGVLGTVLMPRLAYLNKNNNKTEYLTKTKQLFFASILFSVPIMYLFIILATPLCLLFFTNNFIGSNYVMILVAPTVVTGGLSLYIVYVSLNNIKKLTTSVAIGSIINIILNMLLIPILAAKGAAIATLISELSVHAFLLYYLRKTISIKWLLHNIIVIGLIGLVPFLLLTIINFGNGIFEILILSLLYITIYSILILLSQKRKIEKVFLNNNNLFKMLINKPKS